MTKDELMELRRERGKQELNIGDKVIVHSASDKPLYDGKVATIIEKGICGNEVYYGLYIEGIIVEKSSKPLMGAAGIIGTTSLLAPFYAEDLELVKEPTEQIKVGDIVKAKYDAPNKYYKFLPFQVREIYNKGLETMAYADSLDGFMHLCIPVRYLEPYYSAEDVRMMEEEQDKRSVEFMHEHRGKADLYDTYWDAYRAELASKIAVAYAEKGRYAPDEIGGFAVRVANDVVDNLKIQSE